VARAILPTGARAGWDYVLVAKPGVTTLRDYALLLADLRGALGRIHKP
jgi:ribonuclease P protein component